jgi:hypothetical protein
MIRQRNTVQTNRVQNKAWKPKIQAQKKNYEELGRLPRNLELTLDYAGYVTLSPGASYGEQIFSGNGLYDPDITGTGLQPMYFDQLMAMYSKYCVISSKLEVQAWNANASSATMAAIGVYCNTEVGASATFNNAISQPRTKWRALANATGGTVIPIVDSNSTANMFGKRFVVDEDDLHGTSSTNPSSQFYWHIFAADPDGSSNVVADITFRIQYRVRFLERRLLALSAASRLDTKESVSDPTSISAELRSRSHTDCEGSHPTKNNNNLDLQNVSSCICQNCVRSKELSELNH